MLGACGNLFGPVPESLLLAAGGIVFAFFVSLVSVAVALAVLRFRGRSCVSPP